MNTVLVIEDNELLRNLYAKFWHESGFRVLVAGSVREALDCLFHTVPEIVMIDMLLPDGDGSSILNYMHGSPSFYHTQKIVISSDPDCGTNIILDGVKEYLHKPVSTSDLVNTLQHLAI